MGRGDGGRVILREEGMVGGLYWEEGRGRGGKGKNRGGKNDGYFV